MGDHNSLEIEKFVALGFLFEIKFRSDSFFLMEGKQEEQH